jgi:trk system potassium uptake protein TrkH
VTGVVYLVALACSLAFSLQVFPVLYALGLGQGALATELALIAMTGTFITIMLLAALPVEGKRVTGAHGLLAVVVIWLVLPIIASIPLGALGAATYEQALFETVSGLTTTGASVVRITALPEPLLLWRAMLEWLGGYITLACVIYVLAPSGIGGIPSSGGRFFRTGEGMSTTIRIHDFVRLLMQYAVVSVILAAVFIATGVEAMTALQLAMTAISTGGFLPFEGPLDQSLGLSSQFVFALALLIGATSILWQRVVLSDLRKAASAQLEAVWITAIIGALALIYFLILQARSGNANPLALLVESLFSAVSIVSTSGVETRPGVLALLPEILVLIVILAGASVFSTAGGIKLFRLGAMMYQAGREVSLLVHPSAVAASRFSGATISEYSIRTAWTVFVTAIATIALGTILLCLEGTGFQAGFTASVSLFTNSGPVYEALRPLGANPDLYPLYEEMNTLSQATAMVLMILGRLEVLVVLSVLNIGYWLNR